MLILLRFIHVLFGVFWAGTAMFTAAFLIPAVRALGPAGGPVMQQIAQKQKLPVYFLVAGIFTVVALPGLVAALALLVKRWVQPAGVSDAASARAGGFAAH